MISKSSIGGIHVQIYSFNYLEKKNKNVTFFVLNFSLSLFLNSICTAYKDKTKQIKKKLETKGSLTSSFEYWHSRSFFFPTHLIINKYKYNENALKLCASTVFIFIICVFVCVSLIFVILYIKCYMLTLASFLLTKL